MRQYPRYATIRMVIIQAAQVVAADLETSQVGGRRGKTTVVYGPGIILSAAAPVWVAGAMIVRWTSQEKGD